MSSNETLWVGLVINQIEPIHLPLLVGVQLIPNYMVFVIALCIFIA